MTEQLKRWFMAQEWLAVALIAIVFVVLRLPGADLPLHQDEYKWPPSVDPANAGGFIPHPPVGAFIYRTAGHIVGYDADFRYVPLFFGTINLFLLYYLMRFMFGRKEAIIASLIWTFSYFSVLASLMVDTDGQILPFFFLLALIGYHKFQNSIGRKKIGWGIFLLAAMLGGILVKLSFILAIGAIFADFLWLKKDTVTRRDVVKYGKYILFGIVGFVALLFVARIFFPFFDLERSYTYWKHFIVFDRGWFQTFIQCVKAILYASPFLVLVPLFGIRKNFSRVRVFIFFLIFAFIFYILLFDFSIGALDRYLQLLILPLTVLTTVVIANTFGSYHKHTKKFLLLGVVVGLVLLELQFITHYVPSLHPKAEWITRILSFRWNFVYPFSGGSGPLGFYVSFLFMALSWIVSLAALVGAWLKLEWRKLALVFMIPIGILYNGVFIEEYLFGNINGHAPTLIHDAVQFMGSNPEITKVTPYNDNGAEEIRAIGKYRRRLYTDPAFIGQEKIDYLNIYKEFYFVLDVPRVDPTSIYQKYFDSCTPIYKAVDKKMTAIVYDCRGVPDIKL